MRTKMVALKLFLVPLGSILITTGVVLSYSLSLLAGTTSSFTQLLPMSSESSSQSDIALKNYSWQLERWERQGSVVTLVPKTKISLRFENNQVNGSGGCNSFNGSYNLVNNQLSVGALSATRMRCDEQVMNQESQFFFALQSVRCIATDASGRLMLFYKGGTSEGVLYFVKAK
ncbi:META domain-containing protein [Gloeocapsa sp. BRSZ]